MIKKVTVLSLALAIFTSFAGLNEVIAQENIANDSTKNTQLEKHQLFGVLKARSEYDLGDDLFRFSVRNSRIGLKGQLTSAVNYQTQVELSSNGSFKVLDLYATVNIAEGLSLTMGQGGLPIYNNYTVSPGNLMFANRPFIGKFFTGSREIGATAKYTFHINEFPIAIEAGLYNGGEINKPQWTDNPSYAARLMAGGNKGFRVSAKAYRYPFSELEDYAIWGADLRYEAPSWKVETEWLNMHNYADESALSSYYLQGGYVIPCRIGELFDHLLPAARWDAMGYDITENGFQVNRLTLGLGFGLTQKAFSSIVRLDYELYNIPEEDIAAVATRFPGENFNDKLTLELLIIF